MIRCDKCGRMMDGQDEFITVLDEVYCPDCFMTAEQKMEVDLGEGLDERITDF